MTGYENLSAALYIRLSREDDGEGESESVTNQRSILTDFADRNGIHVFDEYVDDGWSGTRFDRPAFNRMTADIEAGAVNTVIVKDLSRLGRDYIMTGHFLERYFPEKRVRFISLLDGIDTAVDSGANDITPFRAIMNDMYAKDISKKIRSVKRDKQRKGQFIGGKAPFGYAISDTEKNRLVIDPISACTVRSIFDMAISGVSCKKIAETLNNNGIPSPSVYCGAKISGKWSGERISEIVRNEVYIGNMVQGKRIKAGYKSKKCLRQPKEDWITVENTHDAIVSRDDFKNAGLMLDSRQHTRTRVYDHLLKGLIFCRECGAPMSAICRKNADGGEVLYLICRTYQRDTKRKLCTSHCIRESLVSDSVTDEIRRLINESVTAKMLISAAEDHKSNIKPEKSIDLALNEINTGIDRAYLDNIHGRLSDDDFERIYRSLTHRREMLKSSAETKSASDADIEKCAEEFMRDGADMREVLCALVDRVEIGEGKMIFVKFKFGITG